jgi:hypothetical protein
MEFGLVVVIGLLALVGVLLAIGKWYPGSGAEQLDWRPTRSYEDEIALEMEDVDQMIAAQNERRRRDGRPEVTEEEFRAEVAEEGARQEARADAWRRER